MVSAIADSEEEEEEREEFQLEDMEEELIDEKEEEQLAKELGTLTLNEGYLTCIKSSFAKLNIPSSKRTKVMLHILHPSLSSGFSGK